MDISSMEMVVNVPERDINKLRVGNEARVLVDAVPGEELAGRGAIPPVTIVFSHFHLDHIVGLPAFAPLHMKNAEEYRARLLKKAAKIAKGAGDPKRDRVGKVTRAQVEEIAKQKMVDLNANDLDAACKIIEGTARSMGIEVA